MKKYLVLLPLLTVCSLAYAAQPAGGAATDMTGQERDAQASLYVGSIRSTVRDMTVTNKVGTALSGVQAQQLGTATLIFNGRVTLESTLESHNANAKNQHAYAAQINPQIETYNATCSGKQVDQNTFNWCQGEIARLTPLDAKVTTWAAEVEASKVAVDLQAKTLDQLDEQNTKDGQALYEKGLKYIEKANMLTQRIEDFMVRLTALQAGFETCKSAIGQVTLEEMHEICGSMFDGNIVHETETNYPVPDLTFKFLDVNRCTPHKTYCQESMK